MFFLQLFFYLSLTRGCVHVGMAFLIIFLGTHHPPLWNHQSQAWSGRVSTGLCDHQGIHHVVRTFLTRECNERVYVGASVSLAPSDVNVNFNGWVRISRLEQCIVGSTGGKQCRENSVCMGSNVLWSITTQKSFVNPQIEGIWFQGLQGFP